MSQIFKEICFYFGILISELQIASCLFFLLGIAKLFLVTVSLATSRISSALMEWISSEPDRTTANGAMIPLLAVRVHTTGSITWVPAFIISASSRGATVTVRYALSSVTS